MTDYSAMPAWMEQVDIVNGESIKRKNRRISFTFRKVRHGPCNCAFPQECDGQQRAADISNVSMVSDITSRALDIESFDNERKNGSVGTLADGLKTDTGTEKLGSSSNEPEINETATALEGSVRDSDNGCDRIPIPGASQNVSEELQGKAMEFEESGQCDETISQATPDVERTFVHLVYDAIAPHFSSTRFAKWPKVAEFLNSLSPGSLVGDVGCGNGKYLGFNPSCSFIGCDISPSLVGICSRHGFQVLTADGLRLPYRSNVFDATISIAVLHHLSTGQRRRQALLELIRLVKRGGKVLITVWAREQEDSSLVAKWTPLSGRHTERWIDMPGIHGQNPSAPMDGIPEGNQSPKEASTSPSAQSSSDGFGKNPLYKAGEVGQKIHKEGYEEPTLKQLEIGEKPAGPNLVEQEFFVPWHLPYHRAEIGGASAQALLTGFARKDDKKGAVVYNRYYHVFTQGELERLASEVDGAVIEDSFYDKSNWCIILRKL